MKCPFCGTEESKYIYIRHHEALGMNLCIRCIDKLLSWLNNRNIDELWTDEDARKEGYTDFPRLKLRDMNKRYYQKRIELMRQVMLLDREERNRRKQ